MALDEEQAFVDGLHAERFVQDGQDEAPSGFTCGDVEVLGLGESVEAVSGEVAGFVSDAEEVGHHAARGSGGVDAGTVEVHCERQGREVLVVAEVVAHGDHEVDVVGVERLGELGLAFGVVATSCVEPGVGVGGGDVGVDGLAA